VIIEEIHPFYFGISYYLKLWLNNITGIATAAFAAFGRATYLITKITWAMRGLQFCSLVCAHSNNLD
jgi:hypothetical protein